MCAAQRPVLDAVLGALAEDAAVALLADEGEPAGTELIRDPLEPLAGAREVGAAQVGRSRRRARRRVREADAVLSTSSCSAGSSSRGVNRATWSRRQKSLRGFAKCAAAAAETRPGLMPQKTTRRSLPVRQGRRSTSSVAIPATVASCRSAQHLRRRRNSKLVAGH